MDRPQIFWDSFRQALRRNLPSWEFRKDNCGRRINDEWTALITESAEAGCQDYAQKLGREVVVGRERHGRIDVHAVIGRFKTSQREALQNQPVGFMLCNVTAVWDFDKVPDYSVGGLDAASRRELFPSLADDVFSLASVA